MGALLLHLFPASSQTGRPSMKITWPDDKKAALSLTWDDARHTQTVKGTPLLDRYGIKATFFVVPSAVKRELEGWKRAVAAGHEIGNHSVNHPCSANFPWARKNALEDYTLDRMRAELRDANRQIKELLGVEMRTFAYPCGQTFVGRGVETRSYVPVVAEEFLAGRNWMAESPNDPLYCDMAQLTGIEMDGKDFKQILPILEEAKKNGSWVVLGGHEMDREGRQTTRLAMLKRLLEHVKKPDSGIWVDTVSNVGRYVLEQRNSLSSR
jgi:peptidoglycan/xylan/chitin deacetylase (PgdA/CDA1 family)